MSAVDEFSGFEVIRAAMEVEKNGHRFYSTMSTRAKDPLIRELFTWLAQDEVGHLNTLEKLAPKYSDGSFWADEEFFLPYLQRFSESEIFPSAERLEEVLKEEGADLKALDLAIEAEEKFADYFEAAAQNAVHPDGKEAFSWLAEEEVRHAQVLRERQAILAPKKG